MLSSKESPTLKWEWGTGYDFFVSLHVLHNPNRFALRGAWAKGVRSRLPAGVRQFLKENADTFLGLLPWVYSLPKPKDCETILDAFAEIPPEERLTSVMKTPEIPGHVLEILAGIAERGAWTKAERESIWDEMKGEMYGKKPADELNKMLDLWARAPEVGEQSLEAFVAYYQAFFAEEETRIRPALEQAVERGQEIAAELPLTDLLEELSEGIRFGSIPEAPSLVMVPSFWISPLIMMTKASANEGMFVFGGRPADASLVPGEAVPDALFRALKALADPTRLRILHYLEEKPQTPTELAHRLRLRAPTVIHHLNTLRLAGLVYVTYGRSEKDKRYAARTSRVSEMYLHLRRYIGGSELQKKEDVSGRPPYVA